MDEGRGIGERPPGRRPFAHRGEKKKMAMTCVSGGKECDGCMMCEPEELEEEESQEEG